MKKPRCAACGRVFQPNPRVKGQRYCSAHSCQKERKRRWQKKKLTEDPVYKANQRDAQKRWRERHPGYWRDYRKRNPSYVLRNRECQQERNRARREKPGPIAKMDASASKSAVLSGNYQLVPLDGQMIAKMDSIKVRIEAITDG